MKNKFLFLLVASSSISLQAMDSQALTVQEWAKKPEHVLNLGQDGLEGEFATFGAQFAQKIKDDLAGIQLQQEQEQIDLSAATQCYLAFVAERTKAEHQAAERITQLERMQQTQTNRFDEQKRALEANVRLLELEVARSRTAEAAVSAVVMEMDNTTLDSPAAPGSDSTGLLNGQLAIAQAKIRNLENWRIALSVTNVLSLTALIRVLRG